MQSLKCGAEAAIVVSRNWRRADTVQFFEWIERNLSAMSQATYGTAKTTCH